VDTEEARARRKRRKAEKPARLAARVAALRAAGCSDLERARYLDSILVSHPAITLQQLGVSLAERLALDQLRDKFRRRRPPIIGAGKTIDIDP
jgi:hypothetical protein